VLLYLSRDSAVRRRAVARLPGTETPCVGSRSRIFAFADGELPATSHRLVRRHLAVCAGCRARLAQTRALRAVIARSAPRAKAPPSLRARVVAELGAAGAVADASRSRR
jgi:mycothiol system anti-sigma-R factor